MILISLPVLLVGFFLYFENHLPRSWMRWGWWLCSAIVVAVVGWYSSRDLILMDFTYAYYQGGQIALNDLMQLYPTENCIDGFVKFPLLAYLFVPFALISSQAATQVFYTIGYLSIIPLSYWLIRLTELNGWKRWFTLGILIINDPLQNSLIVGNNSNDSGYHVDLPVVVWFA